jgi:hypothetical protein
MAQNLVLYKAFNALWPLPSHFLVDKRVTFPFLFYIYDRDNVSSPATANLSSNFPQTIFLQQQIFYAESLFQRDRESQDFIFTLNKIENPDLLNKLYGKNRLPCSNKTMAES